MAPFKIPGMDGFTKVFDFWKSFGDPESTYADLRNKYMDSVADIIKGLFPENMQPFAVKPVDFMNMMVDYYKQYVAPYVEIDADILKRIANGDSKAYVDFFRDYQKKYEESVEKYFNVMGMGLNREADEDYRKAVNAYNKAMISMGELMAVISETAIDSYNQIGDRIQEDLAEGKSLTTFNDFYNVWYSVTEAAFEKLLSTDEFAVVFDDFSDKYAQYMIAQNKVYERMLAVLPIPTNTDMKSLYKTVYDLRKDVRDLKKGVAGLKEEKGDK
jgi:class III poly(R)-hydroxyalkanoic acid synthase PhaE subunit